MKAKNNFTYTEFLKSENPVKKYLGNFIRIIKRIPEKKEFHVIQKEIYANFHMASKTR